MDRQRVLQAFYSYTDNYDSNNLQIRNKKRHTLHVADNSEFIAKELRLSENDVDLAWLIGILHDIGRFEQVKQINGYNDRTGLDHAELGVKILFQERLIERFIDSVHDEDIMRSAISYHNRLNLPQNLNDRDYLFCNIIRDADKADNFRGFHENDFVSFHERTIEEVQQSEISDGVMNCFREHRTIPVEIVRTAADFFLIPFALYFGIVFDCSLEMVKNQGYYKRMLDFSFQDEKKQSRFEMIKHEIAEYMGSRAVGPSSILLDGSKDG
nr:HD domain-containing protein [Clostridia bacterium]